jgi:hypothetical protein
MSQINFHPAPGLGDLMNAWFVVPQNPLRTTPTVIVPSVQATAPGQILAKPRLGDFVRSSFVVPQNPLATKLGLAGLGCGGCGCAGGPNSTGLQGFDMEGIKAWAQEPSIVSAVPNWALWGGAAAAAYFLLMPGGSDYRAARSEARGYKRLARRYA